MRSGGAFQVPQPWHSDRPSWPAPRQAHAEHCGSTLGPYENGERSTSRPCDKRLAKPAPSPPGGFSEIYPLTGHMSPTSQPHHGGSSDISCQPEPSQFGRAGKISRGSQRIWTPRQKGHLATQCKVRPEAEPTKDKPCNCCFKSVSSSAR